MLTQSRKRKNMYQLSQAPNQLLTYGQENPADYRINPMTVCQWHFFFHIGLSITPTYIIFHMPLIGFKSELTQRDEIQYHCTKSYACGSFIF
jgi:hypothetical protein